MFVERNVQILDLRVHVLIVLDEILEDLNANLDGVGVIHHPIFINTYSYTHSASRITCADAHTLPAGFAFSLSRSCTIPIQPFMGGGDTSYLNLLYSCGLEALLDDLDLFLARLQLLLDLLVLASELLHQILAIHALSEFETIKFPLWVNV